MDTLYSWTAKRSGAKMTIEHSCGKISGICAIYPNENGQLVAMKGEQGYFLATPPMRSAHYVSTGVSDLFFNFEPACDAYRLDNDIEQEQAMNAAAEDLRVMLAGAGIAPPSSAALVADFEKRV